MHGLADERRHAPDEEGARKNALRREALGPPMSTLDLLEDACAKLPYTKRAMFGGHGLFAPNGGMFAGVIEEDRMMLKFEEANPDHAAFRALGAAPWVYESKMGATTMKAWLVVPEAFHDEPRALAEWVAKAHRAAPAKAAKKPSKAAKKPSKKAAAKKAKPSPKRARRSS